MSSLSTQYRMANPDYKVRERNKWRDIENTRYNTDDEYKQKKKNNSSIYYICNREKAKERALAYYYKKKEMKKLAELNQAE